MATKRYTVLPSGAVFGISCDFEHQLIRVPALDYLDAQDVTVLLTAIQRASELVGQRVGHYYVDFRDLVAGLAEDDKEEFARRASSGNVSAYIVAKLFEFSITQASCWYEGVHTPVTALCATLLYGLDNNSELFYSQVKTLGDGSPVFGYFFEFAREAAAREAAAG